jgi:hypothetical protein
MSKQIKIFYDSFYFEEVAVELRNALCETLSNSAAADVQMVHILDSLQEKKQWDKTIYFCFGMNRWLDMRNLPPNYVVMQFEPICVRGFQSENYLIICIRAMAIFEYSRLNLKIYKEFNIPKKNIYLFEVGISGLPARGVEKTACVKAKSESKKGFTGVISSMIFSTSANESESKSNIDSRRLSTASSSATCLNSAESSGSGTGANESKIADVVQRENAGCDSRNESKQGDFSEADGIERHIYHSIETKKDVDILFIGNITEYRSSIISKLKNKYPLKNIQIFEKVWGKTRDKLVERSHIVLNMHSNRETLFPLETPRLLYMSQFDVHIVSEHSGDLNEEKRWLSRVHFCDNDFDIIANIFDNEKFSSKKGGRIPRLATRLADFFRENNVDILPDCRHCAEAEAQKNVGRWFDIECKIFESLNLEDERIPNIHAYPLANLPNVSIITLTTPERLKKWKDLMMWNNRHRVYHAHKLEWIIVVEKPVSKLDIKTFNKIKSDLNRCVLKPYFIFYENKPREVYLQITEKRNLAVERCKYDYIDLMDDDDIEMPDALKIKMIVLETFQKKCVGSKSIMCIDKNKNNIFVMNSHFPTESTLTFHKSFCSQGFSPNIHGEGSLMVLSQHIDVIDIPSSLNMIAITHDKNITGKSRTSDIEIGPHKGFQKNLKMFLDEKKANELYEIIC